MSTKVAIVTGSNKGIGFYVVKGLCERFNGIVYLTARDVARGQEAVKQLSEMGLKALFHKLDITNHSSIETLGKHIKETYGGVDLIVNNAALFDMNAAQPTYEQAKDKIDINYNSHKRMSEILYPMLRHNGRVVNVSSSNAHISAVKNENLTTKFSNKDITRIELDEIVENFLSDIKNDKIKKEEFNDYYDYSVSKAATYVLGVLQSKELLSKNVSVNAVHPGFCKTDASDWTGCFTAEEGASAILYAALDASQELTGKYIWFNNDVVDWYDTTIPCYELLCSTKDDPTPYPNQKVNKNAAQVLSGTKDPM